MSEHPEESWAVRSTLIAVADLDRSVAFYQGIGPFEVRVREEDVAVLGNPSPDSFAIILRKTQSSHPIRDGQQSLGLRFLTFNVGSIEELNRIESQLRLDDRLTARQNVAKGTSEVVLGRDPDNLPLVFVYYAQDVLGSDYFQTISDLVYSLDI